MLPADVENDDGRRLVAQAAHDPSRPTLCSGLAALAQRGNRLTEFLRLIRLGCAILVDAGAFQERRRGPRRKLPPDWLFRQAYLESRTCGAIAGDTPYAAQRVVEMIRRLSGRLQRLLLVALALPPDVVAAITKEAPVGEGVREQVLEALRAFVAEETPPTT